MKKPNWSMTVAVLCGCLFFIPLGCDEGDSTEAGGDGQYRGEDSDGDSGKQVSLTVALEGVTPYMGVRGVTKVTVSATDHVAITRLELLVNDVVAAEKTEKPFVFDWDTSRSNDGPINLAARATDGAGHQTSSEIVRVVIINDGVEVVDLEGGAMAAMAIPADYDGTQETHIKRHFTPLENYTRALCVGLWENPLGGTPWNIKAEMGTGTCPHSGVSFEGFGLSDTGAVEFDTLPTQGVVKDIRHFCHLGADNAAEHAGQQVEIEYKVFLFAEQTDMTACPLNSAYPCRCDGVKQCDDGSDCVGFMPDKNGGACALPCGGEEDTESCAETQDFGLFGFCGASKEAGPATHCVVVCSDAGETGSCPPDFACDSASGVCLPTFRSNTSP